jgi:hypothetical protein
MPIIFGGASLPGAGWPLLVAGSGTVTGLVAGGQVPGLVTNGPWPRISVGLASKIDKGVRR